MLPKPMGGETNFMSEVIKVERAHFLSRTGTAAISAPLRRSQCPSSQWTTEERVRRAGARAGALYAMGRLRGRGVTHYQILWKELATEGTSTFKGTKRRVGRLGRRTRSRGRPVGRREVWEKPGGREGGKRRPSASERPSATRSAVCWESRRWRDREWRNRFQRRSLARSLLHSQ